ncbi:MAG: TolC family protein [Verrucomicrobiae bacterium]|nr:TolC family protein [Verrucomicrobiae bacterium]
MNKSSGRHWLRGLLLCWLVLAGCTTGYYRKSADREGYRLIQEKSPSVPNMDSAFTIEQTNVITLDGLPVVDRAPEFLGADGERERDARVLNLEETLALAVQHSRNYQSRKEQLYLSALALSLARHQFAPIFSGSGNANYSVQTEQAVTVGIDEITGQPKVLVSDSLVEQSRVGASGTINASWLLRDVGRITTAFTADFLRFVTGDPRVTTSSQLSATFLRPMLRDAGFKQQTEALIQAERQLLYDLREFTQFRKDFSVQIATAYYGVLGNRDTVRNNFLNLQSSRRNAERTRALAQEGRVTQADLGRLEQQELSAESAWINAIRGYRQALDNFKLQLGLNTDANIVLADGELEALQIRHPEISVENSIQVALAARLDYMNTKDQFEDAERRVDLAANLLKPRVDLTASVAISSDPNDNTGFPVPDYDRYRWNAGLNLDPGLDRKAERNSYRTALITRNRAARSLEQQEDEIKLQVRDSWRTLDQAKRSYEISEIGVKLAERRVEEQNLRAELGRANALDQVDAQNALNDSKNQRTQALVTHTIARLQFWNNMGILYIKDNGQWEELQHAKVR